MLEVAPVDRLQLLASLLHAAAGVPAVGDGDGGDDGPYFRLQVCNVADGVLLVDLLLYVSPNKSHTA